MDQTGNFGQWLRQRRKALGLTQKELAQQAGCAEVTLRKIESGDLQPSAPLVASLARALGVADADLPGLVSLARGTDDDFTARARLLRPQRPNNLPAQLTPLIGRQHDITAVRRRLIGDGARLVTLVGPPGVGKTRLALAVAEDVLEQFTDGVFFVRLGPISDPALVAAAIAQALGMEMGGPNPPELQLRAWLEEKHLLLVLDNFEQIVAAAPLVDDLLRRCPWLHVLATSRQPLRVRGERQIAVQPLALPPELPDANGITADDALRYSAVALFADRAEAVLPNFAVNDGNAAVVADLCRRLDGLPLAIELAAAWVRALSVREIAQRLDDRFALLTVGSRTAPPRQQTLMATLDWSFNLLAEREQTVLRRLAVFAGGCTLAAAEAVCSDEVVGAGDVLDMLSHLVDKSCVVADQGEEGTRYRLLETIRQYARTKLLEAGESERIQERHLAFMIDWAEQSTMHLQGASQIVWLRRYEVEHDNLRVALAWCRGDGRRSMEGLRLAAACAPFWSLHGYLSEGAAHLVMALSPVGAQAPTVARAWALFHLALLLFMRSDFPAMRPYAEEALAIWRKLGQDGRAGLAATLWTLGDLAIEEGNYERALVLLQESLDISRDLNDAVWIGNALMLVGWAAMRTGNYIEATTHLEEFLALAQQSGDIRNTAFALSGLGEIAVRQGHHDRAIALLEESLRLNRAIGYDWGVGTILGSLGWVALDQHDYVRMRANLGESLSIRMKIGDQGGVAWCLEKLAEAALVQGETATAAIRFEQYRTATRVLAAAAGIRTPINSIIDPADQPAYLRNLATLRTGLGEAAFAAAWAEGGTMPLAAVVACALAEPAPTGESQPAQICYYPPTPSGFS